MTRRHGYHVAGGWVDTRRCAHCGGVYTIGEYAAHVRESHTGPLWADAARKRERGSGR